MADTQSLPPQAGFLQTSRTDNWWLPQVLTFIFLSGFVIWGTLVTFLGESFGGVNTNTFGPYVSPIVGLELWGPSHHALFGTSAPSWWPAFVPMGSLIAWAPLGFRFTCYYYRGAYYKAFWQDPPGCAVGEPRHSYLGERFMPLVLQNVHRYFLYFALALMFVLAYDAFEATQFEDGFGIGVGTLLIAANVVLIAGYTFGCHALRHLIGGRSNHLPTGFAGACYDGVSACNRNHMKWAWGSLFGVWIVDIYVRLCAMGMITDLRIL